LKSKTSFWLALGSLFATLLLRNAYAFPILILIGGIVSSSINKEVEENDLRVRLFSNINPRKIAYFIGVLFFFAGLGAIINRTSPFSLPIRLFENFYRNGIMIFGGGQVLVPFMYTEFVEMKSYLTSNQFLSGYAFQQALPGPTFSFTSFSITIGIFFPILSKIDPTLLNSNFFISFVCFAIIKLFFYNIYIKIKASP
jgi:chromate transporter